MAKPILQPSQNIRWPLLLTATATIGLVLLWSGVWLVSAGNKGPGFDVPGIKAVFVALPVSVLLLGIGLPAAFILVIRLIKRARL